MKNTLKNLKEIDIQFLEENISDFHEYSSNKNLYDFMAELTPHLSVSETHKYFEGLINRDSVHVFPIILEGKKVIGTVSLTLENAKRNIWMIGFASSPLYSGMPIILLTVSAVVWTAFKKYNVRRLEGMTQIDNLKSQNLMQGLGFKEEGTRRFFYKGREDGEYLHAKTYSLFLEDFSLFQKFDKMLK